MANTLHIASLLVHARPELLEAVKTNLRLLDGVRTSSGKPTGQTGGRAGDR